MNIRLRMKNMLIHRCKNINSYEDVFAHMKNI